NTGQKTRAYLFVDQFILGKANGLGDMEFASVVAGAEVGNYVWCDANGNGVQDPTEFGIDGIEVVLIDKDNGNQPVDTVTTSGGGGYLFANLLNDNCYEIRINLDQLTALGYSGGVSPLGGDPDTDIDSDGDDQMVPNHSVAMFCTGSAGEHMHDIDFGFLGPAADDCTLAACDDGMNPMMIPCANFDSAMIAQCVDPSGMNVVSFYPTFNDADSMMNEITGSTIRTCNDSCIYARVMRPSDPMCFAISKVTLNVIDAAGTGSIAYAVAACPDSAINLNLTLIAQGLDFVPGSDTFYSDPAKMMMIMNPTMYTPPGYPNTVYFGATLSGAGCMVMGSIIIDSVGQALVNAGDSAIVCGFACIDLTSLGASFNANQSGATDVQWRSSSGAGTFIDDNTFANARLYCPDTVDVANGSVTLYLEVLDDPCGVDVVDSVFILIEPPGARVIPGPRNNVSCKDSFAIDPGAHDDFDGCRIVVNCVDTLVGDVVDYSTIVADCADTTTVGIALNYDGMDDYVINGNPDYIGVGEVGEFTIEAWIRMESYGAAAPIGSAIFGDLRIQGTDGGILLAVDPMGFVQIYRTGSGFLISASQVPLDTWTHLALVQDATGIHLYVNGLFTETLTTAQYADVADTMVLGAYSRDLATFNDFFDGDMDEVRIWDHAREPEAISCDLSTDLSGTEEGLIVYYDFEVGTPCADNTGLTSLPDVAGNGHDGTLVNFDLTGGLADPCESNWTDGALAPFVKYIVRTFEFRYNKQTYYCMDTIGIRGLNWDLFMCPPERDTVYCNDLYRYLNGLVKSGEFDVPDSLIEFLPVDFLKDENGNPSPLETGVPTAGGVPLWPPLPGLCDVQVIYKDWVFEGDCPKTIHRQWFIKNSCLGTFDTCDQWLMIADTSGPHIDFVQFFGEVDDLEDFFLGLFDIHKTDDHECYHEFMVPPIAVIDSCSGVKQVKANVNGQTVAMEYNPETGLWESKVKVKVPATQFGDPGDFFDDFFDGLFDQSFFTYEFLDSCHNRSTGLFGDLIDGFLDTIPIIVADGTPPVTICNKGVNVTVTDTTVWVPATTFDEGSWDNCGVGLVLARRADWATACGVNLCDSLLLVSVGEHGDSLWCAVLEEDKNINPIEAHYAKMIDWLCTDRRVCNYPILAGWAYDLIRYGTLDCIDHPYPVDEAYLDHILSGTGESELDFIFSLLLPCLKDISFEDLIENPEQVFAGEISEEVFFGALEDLFKIAFARGNGFFNLFGFGSDEGFGSFIGDIGKQIGGGWSEEVPFCCEDACQEVTVEILTMDYWCNWSKCWTTVRVEDKTPPKVECELFDVTVTCASYKTYYEDAVNAALDGDFEPLQDALGRYDKVEYDTYGQAPDKSEFTIYELDCDSSLVTKDSLVYDEHFGYVWETFTYYRAEYDTTTRTQYNGQVADNCGLICIEEKPWISIDECGVGFVKRTFKFVGQCTIEGSGHVADTVVRHQTIYITNDCSITKAMFDVPKDTMVFDCGIQYDPDGSGNVSGAADPSLTGQATYTFDNDCRLVGIGYYDKVFRIVGGDGACWKIIRTWCFADWCYIGDEPQAPGWWFDKKYEGKYIQCEQKIILLDSTPPICAIDEIPDVIEAAGCFYTLNTNVTVTDECGVLSYYWQLIDTKTSTVVTQGDGEFDSEVTDGFSISAADLGLTTYQLKVVVRDDCQNESLCEKTFTVDADQKPT
ncbi:MAG: hypothetical protein OEM26_10970, partial [Saprospiraceae bacterium]|nr:hypothetical protein [Saprospiraceae bacterium]